MFNKNEKELLLTGLSYLKDRIIETINDDKREMEYFLINQREKGTDCSDYINECNERIIKNEVELKNAEMLVNKVKNLRGEE